jgi:predicted nucleic acid-binding protein
VTIVSDTSPITNLAAIALVFLVESLVFQHRQAIELNVAFLKRLKRSHDFLNEFWIEVELCCDLIWGDSGLQE